MDRVFALLGETGSEELVANGCLLLASKFEEHDSKTPMLTDLQAASRYRLSYEQLVGVQSELLSLLDFDLMALTPQHFLSQLFATGLIASIDAKASRKDVSERTLVKVREYAQVFCDLAAEHYELS